MASMVKGRRPSLQELSLRELSLRQLSCQEFSRQELSWRRLDIIQMNISIGKRTNCLDLTTVDCLRKVEN